WDHIHAAVLTHTHCDHWNARAVAELHERRIPLHCHTEHLAVLAQTEAGTELIEAGLSRCYEVGRAWEFPTGCRCEAIALNHDGGVTCGFRIDGPADIFGACWALGYATDVGCWDDTLVQQLLNVDVLAVEFNHDVQMQRNSRRPFQLIRRVLGDQGHLSNAQ